MFFFFFNFTTSIHILFVLDSGSFVCPSVFLPFEPDVEGSDPIMFLCARLNSFHLLVEHHLK